eukprot:9238215-Pyramimonas_sp.AAC.1
MRDARLASRPRALAPSRRLAEAQRLVAGTATREARQSSRRRGWPGAQLEEASTIFNVGIPPWCRTRASSSCPPNLSKDGGLAPQTAIL